MLGRSLGNYDVVSQIGEGGMGGVYLARHAMLGRAVAIHWLARTHRTVEDDIAAPLKTAVAYLAMRRRLLHAMPSGSRPS